MRLVGNVLWGSGELKLLLSNMLIFQASGLVELGHAIVTVAAVELQTVWSAVVLGEVIGTLFPAVAALAVLPQTFWTRGLRPCSYWLACAPHRRSDTVHRARTADFGARWNFADVQSARK